MNDHPASGGHFRQPIRFDFIVKSTWMHLSEDWTFPCFCDKMAASIEMRIAYEERRELMARNMKEDLDFIQNKETRAYVERRLIEQSEWYAKKSRDAKKVFMHCSLAVLILNGLVTVLSVVVDKCIWFQVFIALFGAAGVVINGYLMLANTKGQWIGYRDNRENLISLLEQYRMGIGLFANMTDEKAKDTLLVKTCETILTSEVKSWVTNALKED